MHLITNEHGTLINFTKIVDTETSRKAELKSFNFYHSSSSLHMMSQTRLPIENVGGTLH